MMTSTFTKRSSNNDVFGIQDFSQKILLDGLPSRTSKNKPVPTPCKSKKKPCLSTPCTPIPPEFKWIRDISTEEERWRLFDWSRFVNLPITRCDPREVSNTYLIQWTLSTSNNTDLQVIWEPFRARIPALDERKRWSLQEEVTKPFEIAMEGLQREIKQNVPEISYPGRYPDLTQEHRIYTNRLEPGHYQCRNALWIWAELIDCLTSSQLDEGPKYVGEEIKEKFPKESYDMIEGTPSINGLGFVTIKLSGKWIAKSIHKMLKDGIDTWAPKLPVERVIVAHHSLGVEWGVDLIRMLPIEYTLMCILEYSKVDATIGHPMDGLKSSEWDGVWASELLNKWFPCEEKYGEVVTKGRVPFVLPKRDFENAYKDIFALWYGLHEHKADWIVYTTPVQKQAYTEMCLAVAKFEGWIPSDRHKPPRTGYAGFQTCTTKVKETFLDEAISHCMAVSKGEAAKLLGYRVEAVLDCVFRYTSLMNPRMAVCTFDNHMFNEEGNTFVYLLNTRAQIRKIRGITIDYGKEIYELKKASELILEKEKGWEKGEERVLGFHLLKFTEALEESCLSVMPHILCDYLYDLCKNFNRYHSSMCKDGSVVETSTLLLYEATAVVIEKCFHLLGILPGSSLFGGSMTQLLSGLLFPNVERPIDVNARDPTRNFRFEMVCFCTIPQTPLWYDQEGWLFGRISVSDKIAWHPSHFFETEVTHVPLFKHDWRNPIKNLDSNCVYLGNPGSGYLVSFSYFIEICAELYVTNKNECYQLCNHKKEIDLSSFWENSDGVCGQLTVNAKHGHTAMYYILLKDAIDTALKVKFITEPNTPPRRVRGYIQAYYGDEFLYKCQSGPMCKEYYMTVLFRAAPSYELKAGYIPLTKSILAVPTKGSLIIIAYLQDIDSKKVIIDGTSNFKPLDGSSDTITGSEGCSLNVEVSWNYTCRYL